MKTRKFIIQNSVIRSFIIFALCIFVVSLSVNHINHRNSVTTALSNSPDTGNDALTNIYGVEMAEISSVYGLDQLVQANTSWIRLNGVLWSSVESTPGVYDWNALSGIDTQLATAQANGMNVILVVRSTPGWAQKNPGYSCGPMTDNNIKDFANFMGALVDRYKGRVKYWEIWNEPDAPLGVPPADSHYGCWGDPNDTTYYGGSYYGQVLSQVYPAVKNADPDGQVLVGGLLMDCSPTASCNSSSIKFIDGILHQGNGMNFDGIAFHAYDYYQGGLGNYGNINWNASRATTGPVELEKQKYLRDKLASYGIVGKYLINSELAIVCQSGCDATFETTKQYYLAQSFAAALARNFRFAYWYGAKMGWQNTDLLYPDNTKRPAYFSYKFGRSELDNAVFSKDIVQFGGVMGFEFTKSDRRVWIVWSKDGAPHQITLPEFPKAIYDVVGNPKTQSNTVTIGLMPYYIELNPKYYLYTPITMQNYQPILNFGFEQGIDFNGNPKEWMITKGGNGGLGLIIAGLITSPPTYPQIDNNIPIGIASIQLGKYDFPCNGGVPVESFSGIKQTFDVPYTSGNSPVKIKFKYIIYSQDVSTQSNWDGLEVYITDSSNVSTRVFRDGNMVGSGSCDVWLRVPATGWATGTIDLTNYRGQTVTIEFQNWNRFDNFYNTISYIDQVIVEIGP